MTGQKVKSIISLVESANGFFIYLFFLYSFFGAYVEYFEVLNENPETFLLFINNF